MKWNRKTIILILILRIYLYVIFRFFQSNKKIDTNSTFEIMFLEVIVK